VLMPLPFREFCTAVAPECPLPPSADPASLLALAEGGASQLAPYAGQMPALQMRLDQFLLCGGFPLSVQELIGRGRIADDIFAVYLQWLRGDFLKLGKSEDYLQQVVTRLHETMTTPVGPTRLAQGTSIGSHHTVADYLETLTACFALRSLSKFDPNTRLPNLGKNRKWYFTDPFLHHALFAWANRRLDPFTAAQTTCAAPESVSKLVESVVAEHVARRFPGRTYYWKNRREVDLIVDLGDAEIPVEVKYQSRIVGEDTKPVRSFGRGIVVSRSDFRVEGKIAVVPAALFLAWLG